jgi:capsule polysaccharide modification protein KpsS
VVSVPLHSDVVLKDIGQASPMLHTGARTGIASAEISRATDLTAFFPDGGHLATLPSHCKAAVAVNSTAGLFAPAHSRSVNTQGRTIYDLPGGTSQRMLDEVWIALERPDAMGLPVLHSILVAGTPVDENFHTSMGIRLAV